MAAINLVSDVLMAGSVHLSGLEHLRNRRSSGFWRYTPPLRVIKVKLICTFTQNFCVSRILSLFLKKGVYRFVYEPYNPPPPTGCSANETATRNERFGASVLEFFDIVDQ